MHAKRSHNMCILIIMHVKSPVVHVRPVICGNMVGDSQKGQPQLERVAVYHSPVSVRPRTAMARESSCLSLACSLYGQGQL